MVQCMELKLPCGTYFVLVGIKDGVNVHLVVKSTGKVAASAAYKTPTATLNAVS